MKVFVTGVAGFLGSHLAEALLQAGHQVIGIDNLIGGELINVPQGTEFHDIDCNDFAKLKNLMRGSEVVYHCAAAAYEGLSVFSPHFITQNVVSASVSVFSAAVANSVRRIVHCSSMARYGDLHPPFAEDMHPKPCDPYGIGKLSSEHILENLCKLHGVEYSIAVPHNIIGIRQKYDDPFRNVVSIMINLMLQNKQPVIFGDGSQKRCFSAVEDCISCLMKMGHLKEAAGEVINIGPDTEILTVLEVAQKIASHMNFELQPRFQPPRPREVNSAFCSSDKARRLLDYKTTHSFDQTLQKMIEFIAKRGAKKFVYHLEIEIANQHTPRAWSEGLF